MWRGGPKSGKGSSPANPIGNIHRVDGWIDIAASAAIDAIREMLRMGSALIRVKGGTAGGCDAVFMAAD